MNQKEYVIKREKAYDLFDLLVELEPMLSAYFDFESDKNLDLKERVYEELKAGKKPDEISGYMDIFELLPKDTEETMTLWD